MADPFELTVAEAAAAIASGDLSPVELTESYLARIDKLNPKRKDPNQLKLQAFVQVRNYSTEVANVDLVPPRDVPASSTPEEQLDSQPEAFEESGHADHVLDHHEVAPLLLRAKLLEPAGPLVVRREYLATEQPLRLPIQDTDPSSASPGSIIDGDRRSPGRLDDCGSQVWRSQPIPQAA